MAFPEGVKAYIVSGAQPRHPCPRWRRLFGQTATKACAARGSVCDVRCPYRPLPESACMSFVLNKACVDPDCKDHHVLWYGSPLTLGITKHTDQAIAAEADIEQATKLANAAIAARARIDTAHAGLSRAVAAAQATGTRYGAAQAVRYTEAMAALTGETRKRDRAPAKKDRPDPRTQEEPAAAAAAATSVATRERSRSPEMTSPAPSLLTGMAPSALAGYRSRLGEFEELALVNGAPVPGLAVALAQAYQSGARMLATRAATAADIDGRQRILDGINQVDSTLARLCAAYPANPAVVEANKFVTLVQQQTAAVNALRASSPS